MPHEAASESKYINTQNVNLTRDKDPTSEVVSTLSQGTNVVVVEKKRKPLSRSIG